MNVKPKKSPRLRATLDAAQLWADIENWLVPNMRVRPVDRILYFHLVRVTRLAGKRVLRITMAQLAHSVRLCKTVVRNATWRLARFKAVKILDRGFKGHRIEVRVPREIPGCRPGSRNTRKLENRLEIFFRSRHGRQAIFERDRHRCFYCLRKLETRCRVLDHVVPQARQGRDNYRNLVACCAACNFMKGELSAEDLLRRLCRHDLISRREFYRRMAALRELKAGRLQPKLPEAA